MDKVSTFTENRSRVNRFLFLQAVDLETTLIGFSCGCVEMNPAIAHFFPACGPLVGLFVGKFLTVMAILLFMANNPNAATDKGWKFTNRLFTLLIVWNVAVISIRLLGIA